MFAGILPSVSDPVVEMCVKPLYEFNIKYSGGTACVFHSCQPLYRDHEKFGKNMIATGIEPTIT